MGLYTYLLEHHPEARRNRVIHDMQQSRFGVAGFSSLAHETSGLVSDAGFVFSVVRTRGQSLPSYRVDGVLRQGVFYDPGTVDTTSYSRPLSMLYSMQQNKIVTRESIGSTRRSGGPVQAKTSGGNSKPSRPTRSGQTSKPFWSNGKPKCKKGFRYDFKRKLCVKIK